MQAFFSFPLFSHLPPAVFAGLLLLLSGPLCAAQSDEPEPVQPVFQQTTVQPVAPLSELIQQAPPSRPAETGCEWRSLINPQIGLAVWVQTCTDEQKTLRWELTNNALTGHPAASSKAGQPAEPLRFVEFFDLMPGESPVAGIQRIFRANTPDELKKRGCVVQPYRGKLPTQPGAYRYSVIPTTRYAQALASGPQPQGKAPYPCGDWGEQYDHIQYFEVQPTSRVRKLLFVRTGPAPMLFDEQSVHLFTPHSGS